MDRRAFLGRAGIVVGALTVGRLPRTADAAADTEPVAAAVPFDFDVDAAALAGGLCVPVTPYYRLTMIERPIRDAFPTFTRPPDA